MRLRNAFFTPVASKRCYCGKCGKAVVQDRHNMRLHALSCSFTDADYIQTFKEEGDYTYHLQADEKGLSLTICTPVPVKSRLHPDKYIGAEWTAIYQARFDCHKNHIETRQKYPTNGLAMWLNLIDRKKVQPLHKVHDGHIIHKVFPQIYDVDNLTGFHHYYESGALFYLADLSPLPIPHLMTENSCIRAVTKNDKPYLFIHLKDKNLEGNFLFGEGKLSYDRHIPFISLLREDLSLPLKQSDLADFDRAYPELKLLYYLENGGKNPLIPLLGSFYNTMTEQLIRSGISSFFHEADAYKELWQVHPRAYKNLKERTGFKPGILKKLAVSEHLGTSSLLELGLIYKHYPDFFTLEHMTECMQLFLLKNFSSEIKHRDIFDIEQYSKKDILRILHYMLAEDLKDYDLYRDYLNLTDNTGSRPYGLTPANLMEAHDEAIRHAKEIRFTVPVITRFKYQVSRPCYLARNTPSVKNEDVVDIFEKEKYFIMSPRSPIDLVEESEQMHNCVRTYVNHVANGETSIYFLRKKTDPNKSFVTIEVVGNTIWQVKAFANNKANQDTQIFVRKWASYMNLDTNRTNDLGLVRGYKVPKEFIR